MFPLPVYTGMWMLIKGAFLCSHMSLQDGSVNLQFVLQLIP